jgi:uncharacterized membrane protein YbhN (UPF0104 family)
MKTAIWRPVTAVLIIGVTVFAFADYFAGHQAVREQLRTTPLLTLAGILLLYILFIGVLAFINTATLLLCQVRLQRRESLLLTMYSSVINFFGPLQSGPAFRALYLKKKHNVTLRNYSLATAGYYVLYAVISAAFLFSGVLGWWMLAGIAVLGALAVVLQKSAHPLAIRFRQLNTPAWGLLALAAMLQVCVICSIYYVELHSVMPHVSLGQVIIYTGAANFALFVSLTPGAIGFRESFLVFSQRLHHIDSNAIVVANTIDRAMYVVLLAGVALVIFGTHASRRLTDVTAKS